MIGWTACSEFRIYAVWEPQNAELQTEPLPNHLIRLNPVAAVAVPAAVNTFVARCTRALPTTTV